MRSRRRAFALAGGVTMAIATMTVTMGLLFAPSGQAAVNPRASGDLHAPGLGRGHTYTVGSQVTYNGHAVPGAGGAHAAAGRRLEPGRRTVAVDRTSAPAPAAPRRRRPPRRAAVHLTIAVPPPPAPPSPTTIAPRRHRRPRRRRRRRYDLRGQVPARPARCSRATGRTGTARPTACTRRWAGSRSPTPASARTATTSSTRPSRSSARTAPCCGRTAWTPDVKVATPAEMCQAKAAGATILMSIGGAAAGIDLSSTAVADRFVATIVPILQDATTSTASTSTSRPA